ncbi:unnamed protein product [Effrenium voratum]|nr:unnamed protein product [Effrenium voratum]
MSAVMKVTPTSAPLDLRGHLLVLPGAGGIANLGELCVDALITTYGLQRVAIVETRHLLPVAMVCAFGEGPITTAAELYQAPGVTLSVLQLRSGPVEGKRWALAKELLHWAHSVGVDQVLLLASCSAHVKSDADLREASPLRQLGSVSGLLPLGHGEPDLNCAPGSAGAARHLLRGSGLARPLLEAAAEPQSPSSFSPPSRVAPGVNCICGFTNEILDWRLPEQLVEAACQYLAQCAVPQQPLKRPLSWQLAQQAQIASPFDNAQLW